MLRGRLCALLVCSLERLVCCSTRLSGHRSVQGVSPAAVTNQHTSVAGSGINQGMCMSGKVLGGCFRALMHGLVWCLSADAAGVAWMRFIRLAPSRLALVRCWDVPR